MKTIQEIIQSEPVFLGEFKNEDDVFQAFEIDKPEGVRIIFASFHTYHCSGDAFVLFEKNGKLFRVGGLICPEYAEGLEGQWEERIARLEDLIYISQSPSLYTCVRPLKEFLGMDKK